MTQADIILKHLGSVNDWVPAYKLRSVTTEFGWLGHQGDRVCRKLAEQGKIERKLIGRYAHYKSKQEEYSIRCSKCNGLYKYAKDFDDNLIRYCTRCS